MRTELIITDHTIDDDHDRIRDATNHAHQTRLSDLSHSVSDSIITTIINRRNNGTHGVATVTNDDETNKLIFLDAPGPHPIDEALTADINTVISVISLSRLRLPETSIRDRLITDHNAIIVTPRGIELPHEMAETELEQAWKWRHHACAHTKGQADPRSIDDLPDNTKWVDGHPAPATGDEHDGRPPTGYAVSHGALVPHPDEYASVREALVAADDQRVTKRKAATTIGMTETTLKRILHNPDRRRKYALDIRVE